MKKTLVISWLLFTGLSVCAQKKKHVSTVPAVPGITAADVQRMSKMSPEELEAYQSKMIKAYEQQAKAIYKEHNLGYDESILPTAEIHLPVKKLQLLSRLPVAAPSLSDLQAQTAKVQAVLQQLTPADTKAEVEKLAKESNAKKVEAAAVLAFYSNRQHAALLLAIKATQKAPTDTLAWNNLAAMYNLSNLPQYAVPVLQHCLRLAPRSSMVLNNMGQAYLKLGDAQTATSFLKQCLAIDDLNPEANRSMGMIAMAHHNPQQALDYFARELRMTRRASSVHQINRTGLRSQLRFSSLQQQRLDKFNKSRFDAFEEISLSKFDVPNFPKDFAEAYKMRPVFDGISKQCAAEMAYWTARSPLMEADRASYQSLYRDAVEEMMSERIELYGEDMQALPRLLMEMQPLRAQWGKSWEKAIDCEPKISVNDAFVNNCSGLLAEHFRTMKAHWKANINAMVSYAQFDPMAKGYVYGAVANYFACIGGIAYELKKLGDLPACGRPPGSGEDTTSSNHGFDINCPDFLDISIPVGIAEVKLDCAHFAIEASYELLHMGIEKQFSDGSSTAWLAAGIEESFKEYMKIEAQQKIYITWDHNNQFSDVGISGKAGIEVAYLGGAEGAYTFGMNSGFDAQGEVKNDLGANIEKGMTGVKNWNEYIHQ